MVASFVLASLAGGVVSWIFILPQPAVFSAFLTACLAAALFCAWLGR